MENVGHFIEAFRQQSELSAGLCTAGIGAVLFTWLRTFGVIDTRDMRNFRLPTLLAFPLLAFVAGLVSGYLLTGAYTGYYYEIVENKDATTGELIADPVAHFSDQYPGFIQSVGTAQLAFALLGVVMLALWFTVNVLASSRRRKGRTN